jgi:signal peptidase I
MKQSVTETVKTIVLALLAAMGIHSFLLQPFWIPSGSMVPSLLVGDYLVVNKFAYGFSHYSLPFAPDWFSGRILQRVVGHAPRRGDVVVFVPPGDPREIFVKRLIGLPGDTIQVTGGQLFINGALVPRAELGTYVDESGGGPVVAEKFTETLPGGKIHPILKITDQGFANNTGIYTVPPGDYFFMGDNRDNSTDSRFIGGPVGFVPAENLLGPAVLILGSADMRAPLWQIWLWPREIRWGRFLHTVR